MDKISVKCEYYKVNCRDINDLDTQPDREFDLSLWIDKVNNLTIKDRTKSYHHDEVQLDLIGVSDTKQYFQLRFMRLRQNNLPHRARSDGEAQPMTLKENEFLGEGVHAIYDDSLKV